MFKYSCMLANEVCYYIVLKPSVYDLYYHLYFNTTVSDYSLLDIP